MEERTKIHMGLDVHKDNIRFFCGCGIGESVTMLSIHVQLQNSILRGVVKRLCFRWR
jgi:hypothetical protein